MARPSRRLIDAIRNTAQKLSKNTDYQWGHMGACNCGTLAQELTHLTKGEIHNYAMRGHGDWTEQVEAFCPTSEMPMDLLINQLIAAGLTLEDLINLERLKDQEVLSLIYREKKEHLQHNKQEDVILYLNAWADLLEKELRQKTLDQILITEDSIY